MSITCPYSCSEQFPCPKVVLFGSFRRSSDCQVIQRFRCSRCLRTFSKATFNPCFRQNKRQFNEPLRKLLCSGVSLRRSARILNLSRLTVTRKLIFLGIQSRLKLRQTWSDRPINEWQFDDMETMEHTKCKPISITLAVDKKNRQILDFATARMPAKGPLAAVARKKYGYREDQRAQKRAELFSRLQTQVSPAALIQSDQNPHYSSSVEKYFPQSIYETFKGRRGCVGGQGELKSGGFDPLFSLNHTCAMLRANINRLFRRTWCTTKKIERLQDHISIYAVFHNQMIQEKLDKASKN